MTNGGAQSVERALALLRVLGDADADLGVSALAARAGLTISTTHRLLQALRRAGLVEQDARTHRYHLGAALILLGRRAEEVLTTTDDVHR
jgi:DNA-binding IclR family transcriptional regulator